MDGAVFVGDAVNEERRKQKDSLTKCPATFEIISSHTQ